MDWTYGTYAIPLGIAGVAALAVVFRLLQRPYAAGRDALATLGVMSAIWCFGGIMELGVQTLEDKLFWANVQYLGIAWIPLLWLLFALRYASGGRKPGLLTLAALCVIPIITTILVWTNEYHGLMRRDVRLDASGPWVSVAKTYGPWFWVHVAQSYACLAVGAYALWREVTKRPHVLRAQTALLTVALVLPIVGNVIYLAFPRTLVGLDPTPIAFAFSSVLVSIAIVRYGLLDILPAARGAVVDVIADGLLVIDVRKRVVDVNCAAQSILSVSMEDAFGKDISEVLGQAAELAAAKGPQQSAHREIVLGTAEHRRYFDLAASPLHDRRGRHLGTACTLHDTTERKAGEIEREALITELQNALTQVRTLSGLLPICSSCKRIRDDAGYWRQVEEYLSLHSDAEFTHGICPDCLARLYPELAPDGRTPSIGTKDGDSHPN